MMWGMDILSNPIRLYSPTRRAASSAGTAGMAGSRIWFMASPLFWRCAARRANTHHYSIALTECQGPRKKRVRNTAFPRALRRSMHVRRPEIKEQRPENQVRERRRQQRARAQLHRAAGEAVEAHPHAAQVDGVHLVEHQVREEAEHN